MKYSGFFLLSICWNIVGELSENSSSKVSQLSEVIEQRRVSRDEVTSLRMESGYFSHKFTKTDFKQAPINVVMMDYPPYSILNQRLTTGIEGTGETWLILEALKNFFNFSPVIRVAKTTLDMVEKLKNKEADLTLLPLEITERRMQEIDFSVALGTSSYGFLVKRPQNTPKPDALLRPFNFEVWVYLLISLALTGPLIYGIARIRIRLCRGNQKMSRFFSLDECIWFVFGALMKQGSTLEPISDSARILFATWWIFTVIVTAFYTANLTAFLTFNGLELPLTDVNGLAKHPELSWLAPQNEALIDFIQNETSLSILRDMQKEGRGGFMNNTAEALEKVRNGTHVYIEDMRVLQYIIYSDYHRMVKMESNDTCHFYTTLLEPRITTLPLRFQFVWGFAYQKNSSLELDFNIFFKRLHHYGILDFHHSSYSGQQVCDLPKGFKDRPLENRDLLTTYLMIFLGAGLSGIAFVFEYLAGKKKRKKDSLQEQVFQRKTLEQFWTLSPSALLKENSILPYKAYSSNLPTLPKTRRPRTPFAIKYPEFAHNDDYRVFPSLLGNSTSDPLNSLRNLQSQYDAPKTDESGSRTSSVGTLISDKIIPSNRSENSYYGVRKPVSYNNKFINNNKNNAGTRSASRRNLEKTEMGLLVAPFTREEISSEDKQSGAIVEGTVNGLHVLWHQRTNKLIVKDKKKLEESIVSKDGVPCIYVECLINGEPHSQKLVLTDYVGLQ